MIKVSNPVDKSGGNPVIRSSESVVLLLKHYYRPGKVNSVLINILWFNKSIHCAEFKVIQFKFTKFSEYC